MKKYGANEPREMFLGFSESRGHLAMKSFSLVPHDDNSLLLINSDTAPLESYFTGQEIPPGKRVTAYQECIRTDNIENIGKTVRHGTFFGILGSFSFGNYFKTGAIQWSWGFLTEVVGLDPDRLYLSIYLDDDEAFKIRNRTIGIPAERIFRFSKESDLQEHGAGPCSPCFEIYYDRDEKYGCGKPGCTIDCECDRYVGIWNNILTQFGDDGEGNYTELSQKNIDTGIGPECLAVAVQEMDSLFTVDTNKITMDTVCELAHTTYQSNEKKDVSLRIIVDHVGSCTFVISGGIMPPNRGRGYILHRPLRRAVRHRRILGIEDKFIGELSRVVIELSEDGYPELEERQAIILKVISEEEGRFNRTINQGMAILSELEEEVSADSETVLSGEDVFKLCNTYGFPLDLIIEILEKKDFIVNEEGLRACMREQREKAHAARKTTNYMEADVIAYQSVGPPVTTTFIDYDRLVHDSRITVLTTETDLVQAPTDEGSGMITVKGTPFYGTTGGQRADTGVIVNGSGEFQVEDTAYLRDGKVGHVRRMAEGMFQVGDTVTLKVCEEDRFSTSRSHSATHLFQEALRLVLDEYMERVDSYVGKKRLRSDFTHFPAMAPGEITKVEELMNREIKESLSVVAQEMSLDEAKRSGAMAPFSEKYGEEVHVVGMGDFSTELCDDACVANTGITGVFKILSEIGIAAGIHRIEALTGNGLMVHYQNVEIGLHEAVKVAKTTPTELKNKIESMLEEIRALHLESEELKSKLASNPTGDMMNQVVGIEGVKVLAVKVVDMDMNGLRNLSDQLRERLGEDVVVIASVLNGKVNLMAAATEGAWKKNAYAGNLIRVTTGLIDGGGGGRPNIVQADDKSPASVEDALTKVKDVINKQIK